MTHPHPFVVTAVIYVVITFFIFLLSQHICAVKLDRYVLANKVYRHIYYDIYLAVWRIITTAMLVSTAFHCHDLPSCRSAFFYLFLSQVILVSASAAGCAYIDARKVDGADTRHETMAITLGGFYPLFTGVIYGVIAGGLTIYIGAI